MSNLGLQKGTIVQIVNEYSQYAGALGRVLSYADNLGYFIQLENDEAFYMQPYFLSVVALPTEVPQITHKVKLLWHHVYKCWMVNDLRPTTILKGALSLPDFLKEQGFPEYGPVHITVSK